MRRSVFEAGRSGAEAPIPRRRETSGTPERGERAPRPRLGRVRPVHLTRSKRSSRTRSVPIVSARTRPSAPRTKRTTDPPGPEKASA